MGFRRAAAAAAAAAAEAVGCVLVCCVCPCLYLSLSVVFRLQDKLLRNLRTNNFRADDKKGYTPPNVGKKGDTAFHRPRGFRCTCGRWHQSNGPAGCMRFHGRYTILHVFTITVSEHPNTQRPVAQALSSPKSQTYVRVTYLICAPPERVFHLRRAS